MGLYINVRRTSICSRVTGKSKLGLLLASYVRYFGATNEFCSSRIILPSTQKIFSAHNSSEHGFPVIFFYICEILPFEITREVSSRLYEKKKPHLLNKTEHTKGEERNKVASGKGMVRKLFGMKVQPCW
jgi:hypothetical protein